MLHQFFLTSDCLYILMAEKRKELANFDYWLNIINILGKNSPVLVLFNEINIKSATSFIYDEQKYSDLFPYLNIQKLDVNLSEMSDGRFEVLLNTIKKKLACLEHIGKEVPAKWVDIRCELEKIRIKKHITIKEYFEICEGHGIDKEKDQLLILRYFHMLGIVLHFSDDENLCDTIFLDPNWPVDAVYSALANIDIQENNGRFEKGEIYKIWESKGYDYNERAKLLQLMLIDNFDLCYKLPGSEAKYIIPMLLTEKKPEYDWGGNDNLQFRFQYPFRPNGICSRMIVRMHEYIDDDKVWNEGAVFIKNGATAQIIERKTVDEGLKIIEIRLKGQQNSCKDFLTLIREEIKSIQNRSFPNLPFVEMVPCNCNECSPSQSPYFFKYREIENYLKRRKDQIDCRNSATAVSIGKLIGNVFNEEEIKSKYEKVKGENMGDKININLSNIGNSQQTVKTDSNLQSTQKQDVEVNVTVSVEVKQDVKNTLSLFRNFRDDVLGEIDIEIENEKKRIKSELDKVEKAFVELQNAADKDEKDIDEGPKSRFGEFMDDLEDENSGISKALKFVKQGTKKAKEIARLYNNFS